LGQQQACLHARYVFARILQSVDGFDLAPESQPHGTLPRTAAWVANEGTDGRHGEERIWPAATITLQAKVQKNLATSEKLWLTAFFRVGCGLEYGGDLMGNEICVLLLLFRWCLETIEPLGDKDVHEKAANWLDAIYSLPHDFINCRMRRWSIMFLPLVVITPL